MSACVTHGTKPGTRSPDVPANVGIGLGVLASLSEFLLPVEMSAPAAETKVAEKKKVGKSRHKSQWRLQTATLLHFFRRSPRIARPLCNCCRTLCQC
jgi:hypothetical protein